MTEIKELKAMKKQELIQKIVKAEAAISYAVEQEHKAREQRLNWLSLPFIPEDMGFVESRPQSHDPELPRPRIYSKDGFYLSRQYDGNNWIIKSNKGFNLEAEITSKFKAYQLLSMLGLKNLDGADTIDIDTLNKPISEILKDVEYSNKK